MPGEGPYSRKEITDFFLRVFAAPAPQHHFHTAAFKKPTLCHCCSGLLWGVSKQGYRCQGAFYVATNPPPPQTCLALTYARTHVCPRTSHLMHTCVRTCTSPPDCGMSCHKQCKELVDVECKRRPSLGAMAAPLLPLSSGSDEDLSPMARDVATQTEPPHYELWARLQTLEQERDQLLAMVERLQDQVARLEAGVGGAPAPPLAQLLEGVDALHLPPSPDPDP
ncbi:hypothetical protein Y1Q_0004742 [Alligator mississippiensis]|uniref:Phorbol-ester/DAG-type domain-containing protein n=1 Tax=Alligator mississippiensis TaxID=8496 RepID=A0A151N074_ALLMI|nr:hypothetical protein Y1Q_0004742 [Alligator mississippiensis]